MADTLKIEHIAKALADFHLPHNGGSMAETLVPGKPNWHYFTNEAECAIRAVEDYDNALGGRRH